MTHPATPSLPQRTDAAQTPPLSSPPTYANVLLAASGSADELILDFGFDSHRPTGADAEPILRVQRLVLPWRAGKRLLLALQDLLRQYEQSNGPLRLDVSKRPAAPPSA